jgi:hypothetical protein
MLARDLASWSSNIPIEETEEKISETDAESDLSVVIVCWV